MRVPAITLWATRNTSRQINVYERDRGLICEILPAAISKLQVLAEKMTLRASMQMSNDLIATNVTGNAFLSLSGSI